MIHAKLLSCAVLCPLLVPVLSGEALAQRERDTWVQAEPPQWYRVEPRGGGDPGVAWPPVQEKDRVVIHTNKGGGWLGVQLAPVPAPVASQLRIEEGGVMIRNLFKGSPADMAGLERYDVITAVDGRLLDDGMEPFSRLVQSRKAGDAIELKLFRGGQKMNVSVVLAAPPVELNEDRLKYEDDPESLSGRIVGLRGKILRPGPNGWTLDDLGELPDFPDFQRFLERDDTARSPRSKDIVRKEIHNRRVLRGGEVLDVRKHADGTIEVTRVEPGEDESKVEPKVYANMEELKEGDPEAAGLLDAVTATRPAEPGGGAGEFLKHARKYAEEMRRHEDSLRQYQEALREYMKRYQDRVVPRLPDPPNARQWREWRERFTPFAPDAPSVPPAQVAPPAEAAPPPAEPLPEARFEVHPDGTIGVEVSDGPTQLHLTFPDERAFEKDAPGLYQRYRATRERIR